MYPCRVEKRIWREPDHDSDVTRLIYDLEVDEAPVVGYELNEGRWYSGPISFVIWDEDDECFVCKTEDEYPVEERDCEFSYEWIIDNYLMQGWQKL